MSSRHPLTPYLLALKRDATLCVLGIPDSLDFEPIMLTLGRRRLASSGSGGTRETAEMLAFCQAHGIVADVELIAPKDLEAAFARLEKGQVRHRFVLDMALA